MSTSTAPPAAKSPDTHAGSVHSYDDRKGYGYILADASVAGGAPLLLHRQHLRDPISALALTPGTRVLFTPQRESGGFVATDVRLEAEVLESSRDSRESVSGTMHRVFGETRYGFIVLPDGRRPFCHVSDLDDSPTLPPEGTPVQCAIVPTAKGWRAQDVTRAVAFRTAEPPPTSHHAPEALLAQAILARDTKEYGRARELYKQGMSDAPSVQLVLSYAAFEKNQNEKRAALAVYRKGIDLFPSVAKLREDAGVLAGNMGRTDEAATLLSAALDLCRNSEQAGEIGVLLALARLYAREDTMSSLRTALAFYQDAVRLRSLKSLPNHDQLRMSLIRVRLQHHRGNLTYNFLRRCGFDVTVARLLPNVTTGADLVVRIENAELSDGYGISGNILIRCMFKSQLTEDDIENLDTTISDYADRELISDQMVLLVLSSVPNHLKELFFRRIERRDRSHLVVPLAQETMEIAGGENHFGALRGVLDTWLYRRDLFAHTYPVFGKRFFGRDRILAQLRDSIASAKPAGIFGLRKVGKTSLLKECERRAIASGDVVVYVDLLRVPAGVNDANWLYWRIANLLHEQFRSRPQTSIRWRLGGRYLDYLDIPASLSVAVAFDADLSAVIRWARGARSATRPRVVILLDEIERILPTKLGKAEFAGFFDFLSYLRGFAQESQELAVIVTGANPSIVEISQFDGRDNPAFNFFQEVYLQLLEADETRAMMHALGRGMGIRFDDAACGRVFALTGGHPYFAREFCSFLAREHTQRPLQVTRQRVDSVVDDYLEQVGTKDFREIMDRLGRDYPAERDLCVELANDGHGVPARGRVKHLVGYQLVTVQGNRAVLTMELFRKWILEWL